MEKNLILTVSEGRTDAVKENAKSEVKKWFKYISTPVEWVGKYYSHILERPVSKAQTLHLLEAQAAFACSVLPMECPLLLHGAFIGWFAWSVWKCKKAMR